jgi:hypothetical protein
MTDWKATRDGLGTWFERLAKVDHVEWAGEPEKQYGANATVATLSISGSSDIGMGWEERFWNEARLAYDTQVHSEKRVILRARIRTASQLAGEDAWTHANRAETLLRGSRSTEELTRLGWSYHGLAGDIARNNFEHQGREISQADMDLVMSFASVIRDERVGIIQTVVGEITVKDTDGDGEESIPFELDLTQPNEES